MASTARRLSSAPLSAPSAAVDMASARVRAAAKTPRSVAAATSASTSSATSSSVASVASIASSGGRAGGGRGGAGAPGWDSRAPTEEGDRAEGVSGRPSRLTRGEPPGDMDAARTNFAAAGDAPEDDGVPGGSTPRVRTRRWGKRRSSSSSSMASSSSSSGRRWGEGTTPREPVGEVDARSWWSPIGGTAVLRSRPPAERSRPPGAGRGGDLPPPRRGRVLRRPRASPTRSPPGGTSLCGGAPRYGPRDGVQELTFRHCPDVGTARARAAVGRSLVRSDVANSLNTLPLGTWTRAGAARGWGIIRSIRTPWVAPSRAAS